MKWGEVIEVSSDNSLFYCHFYWNRIYSISWENLGDEGFKEYLKFREDYVTPGILMAPSWPDAPINSPGFSHLINTVADGPFLGLSAMTYSDVGDIKPDIEGQSWEELFLPTPQSQITIGEIDFPSVPIRNNEGNNDSSPSIIPSDESLYNEFPGFITPKFKDTDDFQGLSAGQWLVDDNQVEKEYVIVRFIPGITLTEAKKTIQDAIPGIFHSILVESDNPPSLKVRLSTDGEAKWLIEMLDQQYGIVDLRQKADHAASCGDCYW